MSQLKFLMISSHFFYLQNHKWLMIMKAGFHSGKGFGVAGLNLQARSNKFGVDKSRQSPLIKNMLMSL